MNFAIVRSCHNGPSIFIHDTIVPYFSIIFFFPWFLRYMCETQGKKNSQAVIVFKILSSSEVGFFSFFIFLRIKKKNKITKKNENAIRRMRNRPC